MIARFICLVVIGGALLGAGVFFGGRWQSENAFAVGPPSESNLVHPQVRTVPVRGVGYIEAVSEIRRLAFKRYGTIAECRVRIGQTVSPGEVVMVLDDRTERSSVETAEAELKLAVAEYDATVAGSHPAQIEAAQSRVDALQSTLDYVRLQRERSERLSKTNVATLQERDEWRWKDKSTTQQLREANSELERLRTIVRPVDLAVAEAKVALAKARLEQARQQLNETVLTAPSEGRVLEILKREGEVVSSLIADPVLLFADDRVLHVRAEIDERYVSQIREGQQARVYGRGLREGDFHGHVVQIKDVMGPKTIFSGASDERKDLDTLQLFIDVPPGIQAPLGLRVDVEVFVEEDAAGESAAG